jgi:hypothetical protein
MRMIGFCVLLAAAAAGCASITHPERVNQPVENRGDLDVPAAVGNLVVPGGTLLLIHDFHNGSIYKTKTPAPPTATAASATTTQP